MSQIADAPEAKKSRTDSDGDANGAVEKPLSELTNLQDFVFKEVLGAVPEKHIIFTLCQNTLTDKSAILILNKKPFPEQETELNDCIKGLKLIHVSDNDVYLSGNAFLPEKFNEVKSTFIYPATEKHVTKYRFKPIHLLFESPEDYEKITLPYIKEAQFNIDWVYNILDGKKEKDLIFVKDEDPVNGFFLMKDLKWDGKNVEDLYYQAIVVRRDLKSVRDLTEKELPLLENIMNKSLSAIQEKHGLPASRLKAFFHYQPTYYHLHVHVRYIGSESDASYVFLKSVIENIKLVGDYYQRATLQFASKEGHPLFEKYKAAGRI